MNKSINKCPVCNSELFIRELECTNCHTQVRGFLKGCKFCQLDDELLQFIEIFMVTEGNIKQVEKILNCSYPKVKNLLKKVSEFFGYRKEEDNSNESSYKKEILLQLENGEISFDEALKKLTERN